MSSSDLPKVHVNIEKSPCKHCSCKNTLEDNRLTHWQTWMDIRRDTHKKITAQTGRESGDMIMNSADDIHENLESRLIIQYTKVANKPDKYRGCPDFFALPHSLFETCWKRSPTYFGIKTKETQCIVPTIEYVRIPAIINEEKGISQSKTKTTKLTFLKSKYLQQRRKDLQWKLLEIEPHKPIGEFSIIGTSILNGLAADVHLDDSYLPPEIGEEENSSTHLERIFPIIKINGATIYNICDGVKEININIEYDVSCNEARTELLTITNYSSKALRFEWRKINPCNSFENYNMLYNVQQQGFFFNLNHFIVIPQQRKYLEVYFKSMSEGMFKEIWHLIMVPDLWNNKLTVQLRLICVAVIKSFDTRSTFIKNNLHNRVRERIIDESLRKILSRVPEKKPEYVVYTYDKATLFEAVNSSFSPINLRPKYIYNKSVVGELETFYQLVKLDHHPEVWNLNLNTLKENTKEREMHDKELQLKEQHVKLQEKILKAVAVRNTREDLRRKLLVETNLNAAATDGSKRGKKSAKSPKPAKTKNVKAKGKKGDSKSKKSAAIERARVVVPLIKRNDVPITLTQQLEDIIKKLHQPITWANEQQQKLSTAYALFCAYFDKIQTAVTDLNSDFETGSLTAYPQLPNFTPPLPLRMISEYHDETVMLMENISETYGTIYDRRAESWVDDIPFEDYEKRYRAFHCIGDAPKKGTKKGKNNKASPKKASKKEKSSIKSKKTADKSGVGRIKEEIRPHLTVIQYDPYANVKLPKSKLESDRISSELSGSELTFEVSEVKKSDKELYTNNLYTIFYDNLTQAVEDLEAMLILQSKLSVKHNIIQKVQDGFTVQSQNEPETVKIVDLRRVISESLNAKVQEDKTPPRPCYRSFTQPAQTRTIDAVTSDSSLWDILQRPKANPIKPQSPGEYTIVKNARIVDTADEATSVTDMDEEHNVLEYHDTPVQVETWEMSRNLDCDVLCACDEQAQLESCRSDTQSKMKLKVKTAGESFYPELIIDGTRNFKFYDDSDGEEDDGDAPVGISELKS